MWAGAGQGARVCDMWLCVFVSLGSRGEVGGGASLETVLSHFGLSECLSSTLFHQSRDCRAGKPAWLDSLCVSRGSGLCSTDNRPTLVLDDSSPIPTAHTLEGRCTCGQWVPTACGSWQDTSVLPCLASYPRAGLKKSHAAPSWQQSALAFFSNVSPVTVVVGPGPNITLSA